MVVRRWSSAFSTQRTIRAWGRLSRKNRSSAKTTTKMPALQEQANNKQCHTALLFTPFRETCKLNNSCSALKSVSQILAKEQPSRMKKNVIQPSFFLSIVLCTSLVSSKFPTQCRFLIRKPASPELRLKKLTLSPLHDLNKILTPRCQRRPPQNNTITILFESSPYGYLCNSLSNRLINFFFLRASQHVQILQC